MLTPHCVAARIGICEIPGLYVIDLHSEYKGAQISERATFLPKYMVIIVLPASQNLTMSTCFSRAQRFSCMRLLFCSASSMATSLTAVALAGRFFTDALPLAGFVAEPAFEGFTGDFCCFLPICDLGMDYRKPLGAPQFPPAP